MKLMHLFLAVLFGIVCRGISGAPVETPSLVVTIAADTVNNTDNQTSLREAIAYAGTLPGADVVTFNPALSGATITLTGGVSLTGDADGVTIDAIALGSGLTIASTGANRPVLNTGKLTLRGLKLTGAALTGGSGGGGVYSNNMLELDRCTVSGNSAPFGGGALFNDGTATVTRCTFSGNSGGTGGAIYNNAGTLTVVQSTIAGNSATTSNSIYNNAALTLRHCTVAGNSSTISNAAGRTLTIENSIFDGGNAFTSDIENAGVLTRVGANLTQSGAMNVGGGSDSGPAFIFGPAMLSALGDFGGPTRTRPPLPGSAAIDAAVGSVEASDQRGVARPIDGDGNSSAIADLGAVEYGNTNTNLAALSVSAGTLSPVFSSARTYYVADVPVGTTSVTVTPTVQQASATVTVNGNAVASGAASGSIALIVGANPISVVVTSQIGGTRTYTLVVNRPTVVVTNNNNSGAGSLRQGLSDVQFDGQPDMIVFSPALSGATISISGSALVNNSIDGVTIDASSLPAGIIIKRVADNFNDPALYNDGILLLRAVTLTGGTVSGVDLVTNYNILTAERCTFSGNAGGTAGAILNGSGILTLRHCTLSGNSAAGFQPGAIWNTQALGSPATAKLVHCTVAGNSGPSYGGIDNQAGCSLELENCIIGGNGADVNNAGALTLTGANIVQSAITGGGAIAGGPAIALDPQLAALANNDGPTQTRAPLPGSPAIDAAVGSVEIIDQRGKARPIDGDANGGAVADLGALEFSSSNADLATLALSAGALSPVFAAATTSYTASVPNVTASIAVTPTAAHAGATITVNGSAVASGDASNVALVIGDNTIDTVVAAQDGTQKTYRVVVTRLSNDANLTNLVLNAGTLAPLFASGTTGYTASVPFETGSITVTPTAAESHATITVFGNAVASGAASGNIPLNVGINAIDTVVTAQDGTTMLTYTVTITRGDNANLAALSLSDGTLTPAFASGTISYTALVSAATASITVTPTVAQGNATITVNGTPVASGAASDAIALGIGANTINVIVTAPIGPTMKTYTINVIRPYVVSIAGNSGAGSLRQAIVDAVARPGADTIVFDPSLSGQTIDFTGTSMSVNNNDGLTVDASALPGGLTISGDDTGSIFFISGTAVFKSLTITHGGSPNNGAQGAIITNGTLTMSDCTLRDNAAPLGFGGAIFNFGGSATFERCTFTGNSAAKGGAIGISNNCITTLRQCTLAGNSATQEGGAIWIPGGSVTTTLTHCTVVGNSGPFGSGIGVTFSGASATLNNSIVAGNTGSEDVFNFGTVTVTGVNIIQSGIAGNPGVGGGSINTVDPQLSPLGNYGGSTQTMLPMPGSPAIDAAVGSTFAIDQRGKPRPIDGDVSGSAVADIGAVEFASSNADLTSLALSVGTLTPGFAAGTTSYAARVSNATASLTLTPTAAFAGATITVNGTPVVSGNATADLALNVGANVIDTVVTAQDGTMKTYTVTVIRNTLPSAPNLNTTATTGDSAIIGLPFTSPDADGDPVTLSSVTQPAKGSISFFPATTNAFFAAPTSYVGDTSFTYTIRDSQGGEATGTITVTISDNDPPVIAAHADVSVLATDLGGVVVTYAAAAATDNVTASPTITYSKDSGTVFPLGTTTVTVNAEDAAGNDATPVTFDVIVNLAAPVNTTVITNGMAAPGAGSNGLPADAVIASFDVPATDDDGDLAFLAKWTSIGPPASKGTGLFLDNACLAVVGGDASAVGGTGAEWRSFSDPVVDAGKVVCIAKLSTGASAVVRGDANGFEKIARTGETEKFKSFKSVAIAGGSVGFLAQHTAPEAGDLALWLKDGAGPLTQVLREGDALLGTKIKTLVSFAAGAGSPGQGRGWVQAAGGANPQALALAKLADGSQTFVKAYIGAFGDFAHTGTDFASIGLPAVTENYHSAFLGSSSLGGTITQANARAIFADFTGGGTYAPLVRVGDAAVQGANFSVLRDPVLAEDDGIAFPATIKGGTVKGPAMRTLWWKPAGQPLALLAQGGADAAEAPGAKWKAFKSLAIAAGRGPIFTATLTPGRGAAGAWACDFTGALRLLFRTGDVIGGRTVKSFTLLKASVGSKGVTRSFNDNAQVVWLAGFTDGTTAIMTTEVP